MINKASNEDIDTSKKDVEERTEIILNQSNILYDRLENNISLLKNRVSTFFAILVATITFQVTLLQILFQAMGNASPAWEFLLLISPFLVLMIASGILLYNLFKIKKYTEVEIFEEKRFEELITFSKQELLSDFIFFIKNCYEYNLAKYNKEIFLFKISFILYVIGNAYILIIVLLLIINNTKIIR